MTRVSERQGQYATAFVKRLMAAQLELVADIEQSRKRAGVSVMQFVVEAGINRQTYYAIRAGLVVARRSTLAKLRKARRMFDQRKHQRRSDKELIRLMAYQAEVTAAIDQSRQRAGVSVIRFAVAAGIHHSTYFRIMSGAVLVRASTLAKLRKAQRQAAARALA